MSGVNPCCTPPPPPPYPIPGTIEQQRIWRWNVFIRFDPVFIFGDLREGGFAALSNTLIKMSSFPFYDGNFFFGTSELHYTTGSIGQYSRCIYKLRSSSYERVYKHEYVVGSATYCFRSGHFDDCQHKEAVS